MYDHWKKSQYIQVYLNAFSSIILGNGWNLKFSSITKYQFFFQVFSSIFQFFQYEWPPCKGRGGHNSVPWLIKTTYPACWYSFIDLGRMIWDDLSVMAGNRTRTARIQCHEYYPLHHDTMTPCTRTGADLGIYFGRRF